MATFETVEESGIADIDAVLWGSKWSTGALTFSFPTSANRYSYDGEPEQGFEAFTEPLKEATRKALSIYSSYANLTFTEITETASTHADLRFALAELIDANGRAYFPGDSGGKNGDVWLLSSMSWTSLDPGSNNFQTILHEIGHALGLSHQSPADPTHVGWDYSIMSNQQYPDAEFIGYGETPSTPMLADIAALQFMYGANFKHNNTDTVYTWGATSGEMFIDGVSQGNTIGNTIYLTVWDGGGIDTYDFSNYSSDVVADLRPGAWSSPDADQIAVLNTRKWQGDPDILARGSIANALLFQGDTRSLIENAKGGSGNDTLIGNLGNNVLTGNDGDDTFFYTGGFDTFHGGAKGTTGDKADFSLAEGGVIITPKVSIITTRLPSGLDASVIIHDTSPLADVSGNAYELKGLTGVPGFPAVNIGQMTGIESITGSAFSDVIKGNLGDNVINGGGGNDRIYYIGGIDTLSGGSGIDTIDFSGFAYAVSVTINYSLLFPEAWTQNKSTVFTSGHFTPIAQLSGFENVVGTDYDDSISGNSANNSLDGGLGNDTLIYGSGFDTLIGGYGTDTADFSAMGSAVSVDLASTGYEARTNGTADVTTGKAPYAIADLQGIENLVGTSYSDKLSGNGGANVLNGLAGNDVLTGSGGGDRFVFTNGFGDDTITDFQNGLDVVDLSAVAGVAMLKDLKFSQLGTSTLIAYGQDSILLTGVSLSQLGLEDFIL